MQKIIIDKKTNMVTHIICLDEDDRFDPNWYDGYYVVDDPNNEIHTYNLKYDKKNEKYEIVEGVPELPTAETMPSEASILKEEVEQLKKMYAHSMSVKEENDELKKELRLIKEMLMNKQ